MTATAPRASCKDFCVFDIAIVGVLLYTYHDQDDFD